MTDKQSKTEQVKELLTALIRESIYPDSDTASLKKPIIDLVDTMERDLEDLKKPCVIHEDWCIQAGTHLRSCSCSYKEVKQ